MRPRDAQAPLAFKIGDIIPVDKDGVGGEVVVLRNLSPSRQQVYFKNGCGGLVAMTLEIDGGETRLLHPPVSPADARNLAELILCGRPPRMSITMQMNILASAVLAAGAEATKGESS